MFKDIFYKPSSWRSRLLILICLIITFFMFRSTLNLIGKGDVASEAQKKVEKLEQENVELLKIKAEVNSPQFAEKEAREKLGLAKPGEVVLVLPSDDILKKFSPSYDDEEYIEEQPIFKRWAKLFF